MIEEARKLAKLSRALKTPIAISAVRHQLADTLDALADELSEWRDDHAATVGKACAGDELHCPCVPFLRRELAARDGGRDSWRRVAERCESESQAKDRKIEALSALVRESVDIPPHAQHWAQRHDILRKLAVILGETDDN